MHSEAIFHSPWSPARGPLRQKSLNTPLSKNAEAFTTLPPPSATGLSLAKRNCRAEKMRLTVILT
jgi:hypothetical protein